MQGVLRGKSYIVRLERSSHFVGKILWPNAFNTNIPRTDGGRKRRGQQWYTLVS